MGVWLIIVLTFTGILQNAISKIDTRQRETIAQQIQGNARWIALDVVLEVVARDRESLATRIREYRKHDTDVRVIAVFNANKQILYTSTNNIDVHGILESFTDHKKISQKSVDDLAQAMAPIRSQEGNIVGYVIYLKSLENYQKDRKNLTVTIILMAALGLLLVIITTFVIGQRTSKPLIELVAAAERIADGDLEKIEIAGYGSREISRLSESIKRMADALRTQVVAIKKLTSELSQVSKETEGTMTNLASSATQQAAAVNETAATVEEMEQAGQSSAGNANLIVSAAEKTREASTRGRQTVEKTYEIIMQIKDQSQDILDKSQNLLNAVEEVGNVIQSVNSIAEQSKILAVNASIEAAKAGEFGSGFAVVAQEVKDLAQQSKDATLKITVTLTAIREAIEAMVSTAQSGKERSLEGVSTIANAGAVMNDLSDAIRENSDFANVIATNIKQQTVGLTQIAAAIEEINTTALENQTISRNIVDGTRQMNTSFQLLTDMVGNWQTPDDLQVDLTGRTTVAERK
jgi:methyl-accepting chemotaxis protein